MEKSKRVQAAPLTKSIFLGVGISLLLLVPLFGLARMVPGTLDRWGGAETHGPEPLVLPWVSGAFAWGFLILCAFVTSAVLWLDRRSPRRTEPLAVIALCLAVLGHAQGIRSAGVVGTQPYAWPVNLPTVAVGMLILAAVVGSLAWARILLSKTPVRGRVFATCAVVCSLCSAWWVNTFLVGAFPLSDSESGIEVPSVYRSSHTFGRLDGPLPTILIHADGTASHEPLAAVAAGMEQDYLTEGATDAEIAPDDPVLVHADRRATWADVSAILDDLLEVRIWKVHFAAQWGQPAVETRLIGFLPKDGDALARAGPGDGPAAPPRDHIIHVGAGGELHLDGEPCADQAALLDRLNGLDDCESPECEFGVEPDDEATWGDVLQTVSTVHDVRSSVNLGPLIMLAM